MAVLEADLKTPHKTQGLPAHLEAYKWKPGQVPNPGGRPAILREVKQYAATFTQEAVDTLVHLMRSADSEEVRHRSAIYLINRVCGMPSQEVKHSGEVGISSLTTEEKAERLALLMQAAAAAGLLTADTIPALVADTTEPDADVLPIDTDTPNT